MCSRDCFFWREFKIAVLMNAIVLLYSVYVFLKSDLSFSGFIGLIEYYLLILVKAFVFSCFIYFACVLFYIAVHSRFRDSPSLFFIAILKQRWSYDRFVGVVWPFMCLAVLIPSFNVFKQLVLNAREFLYDDYISGVDYFIFGGSPGLALHEYLGIEISYALDGIYHAWFFPMLLGVFGVCFVKDSKLRFKYMACYVFCWTFIGSYLAYVFSSAGPCFYNHFIGYHGDYIGLSDVLSSYQVEGKPIKALEYQEYLISTYRSDEISIGGGVSAMPSVHVALATIFALGAGCYLGRMAGWAMALYVLCIWVGSVYLGWHYFSDGALSISCVFLFWWLISYVWNKLCEPLKQPY